MKTTPLTIRGCPEDLQQALKDQAKANRRSLNAQVLTSLERNAETERIVTGPEWAQRLRKARKMLTEAEHKEFARDIEEGIRLNRCESIR